jgi:hypothetical protein
MSIAFPIIDYILHPIEELEHTMSKGPGLGVLTSN